MGVYRMSEFELDLNIYPLQCILTAIENYNQIVAFSYQEDSNKNIITLEFCSTEIDPTLIKDEFCNHLIELISRA